jgi:murein DD-endopeptidase MepM/ murein hydrolase activator NlpD
MEIDHGTGMTTLYGHLRKPAVKTGQQVKRGEKIAYLGDSGRSTGSHLHYEVIVSGVNVDPQRYMLK